MAKRVKKKGQTAAIPFPSAVEKKLRKSSPVRIAMPVRWRLIIATALALLAVAVYGPSYNYDFVYDDDAVVKENKYVQQGLDGLGKIWTTTYFKGYDETINARAYRPVPLTTLALEYEIWGLNATVNHLFNLLFYGLTAFFLFLFLSRLLKDYHPALPVIVSLLFLLHPIHLEVVANIKSRDTMLGFLGFTLAGWLLLKYIDNRRVLNLLPALLFYFLGLFSKEEVITTAVIIPLMLWFFRDLRPGKIALLSAPFWVAAIVFLVIRSNIVGGLNAGVPLTELDNSLLAANGVAQRTASNLLVLGNYLLKTVYPHPLISDYSYLTLPLVGWDDWRVYVALLANIALLGVGIYGLVKRKIFGFAALYYFVTVSIFTSILVTNVSAYNDRFLYSPVLGICLLTGWMISTLIKQGEPGEAKQSAVQFFKLNFLPVAITVLLAAVCILKIERSLPYWRDRYALFDHDAKLAPYNARMRKNHGGSLARLAIEYQEKAPDTMQLYARQALQHLDTSLMIYNNIPTGHIHKGNMHLLLGEYEQAENSFKTALGQDPGNYYARVSLANVYYRTGSYKESIDLLESIQPNLRRPNDFYMLSLAYSRFGDTAKAEEYRKLSGR
jgi:tetratricopeptide (TPR) repeat protein